MKLTQNHDLNVGGQHGSANRLVLLSSVCSKQFWRWGQMFEFW